MTGRLIAFVAVVLSLNQFADAQPLADRVPSDAVIYVGWAGADSMGPGYDGSHLKAILEAAEVKRIVDEVIPKLLERVAQEEPQAGEVTKLMSDVAGPMWRHPTAVYVGPIDMTNPREPMPRFALLCEAGEDAPALKQQLDDLLAKVGENKPMPMEVRTSGNLVAFVVGKTPELDAVIDGKTQAKALLTAKPFAEAMSGQKSPVMAAYVDAEAVVKFIDAAVAKGNDAKAKEKWPAARDALGLRGLKRLSFSQGFDGKDWGTHVFVEAPAPRQGLLAAMEAQPVSDAALKSIPSSATVAGVARMDLAGVFDGIREAVAKLDKDGKREMEDGMKQVNELLGLDFRQDMLAPLGNEWSYYIAPEITGRGPLGVVVVNRLKDAAKAESTSDKLKDVANKAIARQADPNVHFAFKQAKVGDLTVHYLATPFVTPSWVIRDGNLYIGLYPQLVAQAAGHVSSEGKSILDNESFIALRKRLGGEKAVSVQFYDLPKSAPSSYQVWLLVSSLGKFGDLLGVDTPVVLLPPLNKLMEHLTVSGAVTWVDDKGWHFRGVTPFPGATTIASETAGLMDVQSSALMASILLPSVTRAREQANRVKSASNLRQIGQGIMMYANEHKGRFPDDLAGAMGDNLLTVHVFVNPRTKTAVPRGLEGDALKKWVNESSDYVFLGKGKDYRVGAEVPIAHEKPQGLADGLNILYGDGHVEFLMMPQATQVLEKARQGGPDREANPNRRKE